MTAPLLGPNGEPIEAVALAIGDGTANAPTINVTPTPATTGTDTQVNASVSAVTLLAANASRRGAVIVNDSTAVLYVICSATAPTSSKYTYRMAGSNSLGVAVVEIPFDYTGIIQGIWASATGAARITEFT